MKNTVHGTTTTTRSSIDDVFFPFRIEQLYEVNASPARLGRGTVHHHINYMTHLRAIKFVLGIFCVLRRKGCQDQGVAFESFI